MSVSAQPFQQGVSQRCAGFPVAEISRLKCSKHVPAIAPNPSTDTKSRERQLERPSSGAAAAKGKTKSKGKKNSGDCARWTTIDQRSRGDKCGMKHNPEKKRQSKGKGKGSRPPSSSRRNSLETGNPDRKKFLQETKTSQHASPSEK